MFAAQSRPRSACCRLRAHLAIVIVAILVFLAQPSVVAEGEPLLVAAASDLQFALPEIISAFQQANPGLQVRATFGSSGTLVAQIENGAPFDIFLSADTAQPERLKEKGFVAGESIFPYAQGHLALWTTKDSPLEISKLGLKALLDPAAGKIAIANPKVAPYGAAAERALKKAGLYQQVEGKLVVGENVAQAGQFVQSGAAQAGLISLSLALSPKMQETGNHWVLPADAAPPLDQAGVVLKGSRKVEEARKFQAFLTGAGGREGLSRFGFTMPADK